MSNPVLQRWEASRRTGPAIFASSGETLRTWEDIEAESRQMCEHFSRDSGVVALQAGNHASFPALLLAAWRAGRAVCLCDPGLPNAMVESLGPQLGISLHVTPGKDAPVFRPTECKDRPTGCKANPPAGIDLYKLTSGTVARPQPLAFTASQLLADADQVCDTMGLGDEDRNFGVISFAHSYGFSNLITPLIARGIPLVISSDALPRAIQSGLADACATVLPAVPAMFRSLLACDSLPPSLRLCISAGAPLDPQLGKAFHGRFGLKIHSFYGASECGGICYDASEELPDEPGFVGLPMNGVTIEAGRGPSRIRIVSQAVGIREPAGSLETSDILIREPNGYRIVGRESDILNVAGRKASPQEIEEVLKSCPGVQDAVVCGVNDLSRGQEICALVQGEVDRDVIRRHCATRLSAWKIPRRLAFADAIPVNTRGKISRAAIANTYFPSPD